LLTLTHTSTTIVPGFPKLRNQDDRCSLRQLPEELAEHAGKDSFTGGQILTCFTLQRWGGDMIFEQQMMDFTTKNRDYGYDGVSTMRLWELILPIWISPRKK